MRDAKRDPWFLENSDREAADETDDRDVLDILDDMGPGDPVFSDDVPL